MCAAFGDEPGKNLEILIGQMVNLLSDGQPMRMSKRAGTVLTIEDLVGAIGVDASRYALARYSSDSNIDIDLDLWAKQTNDNPVYYVQYAHARVSGILRNAGDLGIAWGTDSFDPGAALPREGGRAAAVARRLPAGRGQCRRAARAAPGRALPRGHGRGLPPLLRQLPGAADGRRGGQRPAPGPPGAGRGHPHGARQRPRPARRLALRSACSHEPRSRLGARARRSPRSRLAAGARRRQRPGPAPVVVDRPQGRRRAARRWPGDVRAGRRRQHAGVRPRRGRLPGPGPRLPRRVLVVRRLLRRQGLRLHGRRRVGRRRRGSASTSAPTAS